MKYTLSIYLCLLALVVNGCKPSSTDSGTSSSTSANANLHHTYWQGALLLYDGQPSGDTAALNFLQIDSVLFGNFIIQHSDKSGSIVGKVNGNHVEFNVDCTAPQTDLHYTFSLNLAGNNKLNGIWIRKWGAYYNDGNCSLEKQM